MVRTQVQLTEEQVRSLRTVARRQGVSVAEVVRRCVDESLSKEAPSRAELYDRASRLVGRFSDRDGATDLAENHDRYLDEAFADE